ncbi:MAG: ABC transporter permease [Verrucomicrobia bacterium]|nr:ABC transporter permease [Verrucomicrobiota bacterium]
MHLSPLTILLGALALTVIGYMLWLGYAVFTSPIPVLYNFKSVLVRWRATAATVLGVALVVTVYILMQAMAAGLVKSSQNTGDPRNVMIVRKGSTAESSSQVSREQLRVIQYWPEIERDAQGRPFVSADIAIIINLPRRDGAGEANVSMRGVTPMGMELRPQVKLVDGRWFTPGKREAAVSVKMAKRFANCDLGQKFKTGGEELTVVGWFDGSDSAFDSEMWMDADEARSVFDRENYSSVLARVGSTNAAALLMKRIDSDKRMPLRADLETDYYAKQTTTALPIKILGQFLATAMSIGAIFAAMNTMYASVGARTQERRRDSRGHRRIAGLRAGVVGTVFVCGVGRAVRHAEFQHVQRGDLSISRHAHARRAGNDLRRDRRNRR